MKRTLIVLLHLAAVPVVLAELGVRALTGTLLDPATPLVSSMLDKNGA